MIPVIAVVRWRTARGRRLGIWLPLFLVWIVALPFALILLPFFLAFLAMTGRQPFRCLAAAWQLFAALSGSSIDFDGNDRSIYLALY